MLLLTFVFYFYPYPWHSSAILKSVTIFRRIGNVSIDCFAKNQIITTFLLFLLFFYSMNIRMAHILHRY